MNRSLAVSPQPPFRHRPPAGHGLRPVLGLVGRVLLAVAGFMTLPMLVDIHHGHHDWLAFAWAAVIAASLGRLLTGRGHRLPATGLSRRQAFVLTPLAWLSVAAVSALPFLLSDQPQLRGQLTHAVFESVSGITTTGATVISGLDQAAPGLLLWRALLQWLGGIGIIATAIAILPTLGMGGMQLFRTESSDNAPKAMPRVRQVAITIGLVYLGLTTFAALAFLLAGMRPLDAAVHALTSVSTGGHSTSDQSLAPWRDSPVIWLATVFMLSGAVPFVLYVRFIAGDRRALFDRQVRTLLAVASMAVILVALWLLASHRYGAVDAFRHALFTVVSILTTTGYVSDDFGHWGNAMTGLLFGLMFIGGCTGSTSGGLKIFRLEVMAVMLRGHFRRLLYPRGVFPNTYDGRPISDEVIGSVVAFVFVFLLCHATGTIALMALDLDFLTSASSAASALANVGPALGDVVGAGGHYAALPDAGKWLLCALMLLGRLEIFTLLILFTPRFWRG